MTWLRAVLALPLMFVMVGCDDPEPTVDTKALEEEAKEQQEHLQRELQNK